VRRQLALRLHRELVVDSFAGGGGASLGIELALGRSPDIAINHDPEAIAMHAENHPNTRHFCESVWDVDPIEATGGRPVGLFWLSPDCKHFSKAKGGKPVSAKVRSLAWTAVRWASAVKPRVIFLENVEEFEDWGPLVDERPCPLRKGFTFRRFVARLRGLGYHVEWRQLRAADYGAPTTRKRLFLIARCDGQPIEWPEPTHGTGRAPRLVAASCIDWSIPCPSIFERTRPLAEPTMRRIAHGFDRFVVRSAAPFVVTMRGTEPSHVAAAAGSIAEPLRTISAGGNHHGVVAPYLVHRSNGERPGQAPRVYDPQAPLGTIVAQGQKHALCVAWLAKHYTERPGGGFNGGSDLHAPMGTVTTRDHHALLRAFLIRYNGQSASEPLTEPLGTLTTRDRYGLVTVAGEDYVPADIGMRMLVPRELYRAQGFPDTYVIDTAGGARLTKTAQVRLVGNSVSPPVARALVAANFTARAQRSAQGAA
jgi:DNA (cytosine-5)-methyltransferase 1